MPPPIIAADEFSGRVTLRLAKSLHRMLAQALGKEVVSLNQYLTNILNYYLGYAQATKTHNSGNIWKSMSKPEKLTKFKNCQYF